MGKSGFFPSSRVFRQQDQTQSQRVNRQIRNFITKNNFTFSLYRCLFFVWLRRLWEWMRKIHLPTSIKQTKFVSRIQAYRSSVYHQGFRGFTFSSTQSRQTKAESYVKCEAESSRCHKTISSTKNFFHQTDGKSIISLSSVSSFPLAYTIYACGLEFHSISFDRHFHCDMLKSFVLRSPSSCCLFP